jgi:recombination protein U
MGSGRDLEKLIVASVKAQGLAIDQTSPRSVATGKRDSSGRMITVTIECGQLDFVGNVRGRYVTFDAKSCKVQSSFPLRDIRKHQAVICRNRHLEGACAFFLIELTQPAPSVCYAMPWPVLEPFWREYMAFGQPASIPRAAIERYCLPVPRVGKHLDLVGILDRLMGARV